MSRFTFPGITALNIVLSGSAVIEKNSDGVRLTNGDDEVFAVGFRAETLDDAKTKAMRALAAKMLGKNGKYVLPLKASEVKAGMADLKRTEENFQSLLWDPSADVTDLRCKDDVKDRRACNPFVALGRGA